MSSIPRVAGRRLVRSIVVSLAAGALALGALPAPTSHAAATTTTRIWASGTPSGVKLSSDKRAVELGTRFTAKVSGKATGIRFYKLDGMTGKHVGTLWSAKGKKLARVTFKKESASGWQTATFKKAVKLKAGKTYVVSYHVRKNGRYGITTNSHASSTMRTLSVPSVNAGVFRYSSKPKFPKHTWQSSQYWVDVKFKVKKSAAGPVDTPVADAGAGAKSGPATSSLSGFPTRSTTGVPSGWTPKNAVTGNYVVDRDGAVVEDLRITDGVLYVRAKNVTLRRVELSGARIVNDYAGVCYNGLRIEDSSILRGSNDDGMPAIESGGYTALRVRIDGPSEGFRAGEKGSGCGPSVIQDSWVKIDPPDGCANLDWHGDALQGYQGPEVTIRNTYLNLAQTDKCQGTSALFYPNQGNTKITVDKVLLAGGGYVFRTGTPGSVNGLKIIDGSWDYGPVDVEDCSKLTWGSGNELVSVNADGSLRSEGALACVTR